jgi:hypothetical protein
MFVALDSRELRFPVLISSRESDYIQPDYLQPSQSVNKVPSGYRKSATVARRFVCHSCGADFSTHTNLNRHKFSWKCGRPSKMYYCQYCQRSYNRKDNLDKHLRKEHSDYWATSGTAAGRAEGISLAFVERS